MDIKEGIYTRCAATSGLVALVGARMFSGDLAQDTSMPAVCWHLTGKADYPAMGSSPVLNRATFTFDVWALNNEDATQVARQIETAFNRYKTSTGITIYDTFHVNTIDLGVDPDTRHYHIAVEVILHYDEQ